MFKKMIPLKRFGLRSLKYNSFISKEMEGTAND